MSKKRQYENDSQQRIFKVVKLLFNDPINGIAPVQIARELGVSQSMVTHDLANLKIAGIAERDEHLQTWRLTPDLPQQNFKALAAFDRAEQKINDIKQRYTRSFD